METYQHVPGMPCFGRPRCFVERFCEEEDNFGDVDGRTGFGRQVRARLKLLKAVVAQGHQ